MTRSVLPDGRNIALAYNERGDLASLTPAGRLPHTFTYGPTGLKSEHRPLAMDASDPATCYKTDHQLTEVTRPGGVVVSLAYDVQGRLQTLNPSTGTLHVTFNAVTGNVSGLLGPCGEEIGLTRDGGRVTQTHVEARETGPLLCPGRGNG